MAAMLGKHNSLRQSSSSTDLSEDIRSRMDDHRVLTQLCRIGGGF
jgi:hypothetical protein